MLALRLYKAIETHVNDVFFKITLLRAPLNRVSIIINHHGHINTIITLIKRVDIIKAVLSCVERV
jgi:hypothetical protein